MAGKKKGSTAPTVPPLKWAELDKLDDHSGTPTDIKRAKYKKQANVQGKKAPARADKAKRK